MKKILIVSFLALLISACSEAKIDGSSEESAKSSIHEIKQSLSKEQKIEFEKALNLVLLNGVSFADIMSAGGGKRGTERVMLKMAAKIDGKTAQEIIDLAKEIKANRKSQK